MYFPISTHVLFIFFFFFYLSRHHRDLHSFPTRRSSDLSISTTIAERKTSTFRLMTAPSIGPLPSNSLSPHRIVRSEEHTSELQSLTNLVCRLLLEKKKKKKIKNKIIKTRTYNNTHDKQY